MGALLLNHSRNDTDTYAFTIAKIDATRFLQLWVDNYIIKARIGTVDPATGETTFSPDSTLGTIPSYSNVSSTGPPEVIKVAVASTTLAAMQWVDLYRTYYFTPLTIDLAAGTITAGTTVATFGTSTTSPLGVHPAMVPHAFCAYDSTHFAAIFDLNSSSRFGVMDATCTQVGTPIVIDPPSSLNPHLDDRSNVIPMDAAISQFLLMAGDIASPSLLAIEMVTPGSPPVKNNAGVVGDYHTITGLVHVDDTHAFYLINDTTAHTFKVVRVTANGTTHAITVSTDTLVVNAVGVTSALHSGTTTVYAYPQAAVMLDATRAVVVGSVGYSPTSADFDNGRIITKSYYWVLDWDGTNWHNAFGAPVELDLDAAATAVGIEATATKVIELSGWTFTSWRQDFFPRAAGHPMRLAEFSPDADAVAPLPDAQIIHAGFIAREPVAYGPLIVEDNDPPIVARLVSRDDPSTPLDLGGGRTALNQSFGRTWQDTLDETGHGSISFANDDPDLALVTDDTLIRLELYGVAAITIIPEEEDRVEIDDGEEHDEVTTWSGRGHLALTEDGEIQPSRGCDVQPTEVDRAFNWSAPSTVYDDSSWATATQVADVVIAQAEWPYQPFAENWPDPGTGVLWAHDGTTATTQPGTCYFRTDFVVATEGRYLVYTAADNEGDLYLDGQLIINIGGFQGIFTYLVYMTAGIHTLAAVVTNNPQPPPMAPDEDNPAGLIVAIYSSDPAGQPDTLLLRSDASWKIVEYADHPPGMTPGRAIRVAVEEAQARGWYPALTLGFTDDVDSEGNPWPEVGDIATKTGTNILTFLRELSATYVDIWMRPGAAVLDAWVKDQRGTTPGVTFTKGTDVTGLRYRTLRAFSNALLIRWQGGWHERTDAASIAAHGRREALLGLGAQQSVSEIERIGDQQLAVFANRRSQVTAVIEPADDDHTPYLGINIGDIVTMPGRDGTPTAMRYIDITVTEDDETGQPQFQPVFGDVILEEQERFAQWLQKMSPGVLGGHSKAATPAAFITTKDPTCCPPPVVPVGTG